MWIKQIPSNNENNIDRPKLILHTNQNISYQTLQYKTQLH